MKHVYFGSLINGTEFLHQRFAYKKIDDEHVKDMMGNTHVFEPHYGCVITPTQYEERHLTSKDERPID